MADGIIQDVQESLRGTLAACYAWQNWQGNAWTEAQALARIYHDALPAPAASSEAHTLSELKALRPFALIYTEPDWGFRMRREAAGMGYDQAGTIIVCIEQDIPESIIDDPAEIDLQFRKGLGNLLRSGNVNQPGLAELADIPGEFVARDVRVYGPVRTEEQDVGTLGDAQRVWLEITWGVL